jgi:hypothetical protein
MGELFIKMKLKCKRCDYIWDYKGSNKFYATCPYCLTKVRVLEYDQTKENHI